MNRIIVPVVALSFAGVANAQSRDPDVHLDLKAESHNTLMTAPIAGAYLGGSLALGSPDEALHPRAWLAAGAVTGLESTGLAFELGGSLTYYGGARREGIGFSIDAGASMLRLRQHHDNEKLVGVALIAEPSIVFSWKRLTLLVGLRMKNVIYELVDEYDNDMTTASWFAWKPEAGLKAGLRIAL